MRIFDNFGLHDYHLDVPQFWMGHIQSRDAFRPNARERKYLLNDTNNLMMTLFLYEYLKLYTINIKQETGLVRMKVVKITVFLWIKLSSLFFLEFLPSTFRSKWDSCLESSDFIWDTVNVLWLKKNKSKLTGFTPNESCNGRNYGTYGSTTEWVNQSAVANQKLTSNGLLNKQYAMTSLVLPLAIGSGQRQICKINMSFQLKPYNKFYYYISGTRAVIGQFSGPYSPARTAKT